MIPILLTTTNEKQPDSVVAWDILGGNPIATFPGEPAQRSSLTSFGDGVICAAFKKPIIQLWNVQSAASGSKRILTKSLVNALTCTPDNNYIFVAFECEVYVYQTSSGCLVGVFDGSHSAKIVEIKLSHIYPLNPALLITADLSGFVACWSLAGLMDQLGSLSTLNYNPTSSTPDTPVPGSYPVAGGPPLWYSIHTSHGLPRLAFIHQTLLVCGSEGLKAFDLLDGSVRGVGLTGIMGGLQSICTGPVGDNRVFCGGADGLLHSTTVLFHKAKITINSNKEVRRCFVGATLPPMQKTITELVLAPGHHNLLIVGALGGLIEVMRTDALLTCLQHFSILNPTITTPDLTTSGIYPQLTGLCLIPRPSWLSTSIGSSGTRSEMVSQLPVDQSDEDQTGRAHCGLEPFKRHVGWRIDDLIRLRLPAATERLISPSELLDVYMDDFYSNPLINDSSTDVHVNKPELVELQAQINKLTSVNRNLLRQLMDQELRS